MVSKFLMVGTAGFIIDALIFALVLSLSDHVLISRLLSFWIAASFIWVCNRHFTFRSTQKPALKQWSQHMLGCHISGLLNIGLFAFSTQWCHVSVSFMLGIMAGTAVNYMWSSSVVY